jgi:hypothetical protein
MDAHLGPKGGRLVSCWGCGERGDTVYGRCSRRRPGPVVQEGCLAERPMEHIEDHEAHEQWANTGIIDTRLLREIGQSTLRGVGEVMGLRRILLCVCVFVCVCVCASTIERHNGATR